MPTLNNDELAQLAVDLPLWRRDAGVAISRDLVFADFRSAFAFMTDVAEVADRLDHHPEWSNVYNKISIRLTTHDAHGLTSKDCSLARAVDIAAVQHMEVAPKG